MNPNFCCLESRLVTQECDIPPALPFFLSVYTTQPILLLETFSGLGNVTDRNRITKRLVRAQVIVRGCSLL